MTPVTGELDLPDAELDSILGVVARKKGLDLRDYLRSTLAHQVTFRMEELSLRDPVAYRALLERDPVELDRLAAILLIHVTSFFRDPRVFAALEASVLPLLLETVPSAAPLRAWVVGAATGAEPYSLAMILAKRCAASGAAYEVLATDRSARTLETAREGRYREDEIASVPRDARERFLRAEGDRFRVAAELRDHVCFAEHDFLSPRLAPREAVLATFDLVLCRNVLIYMDARFQVRAFDRLAAVVRTGGVLVLGLAESLPASAADRFEPLPGVDPALRLYRRKPSSDESPRCG